MDTDFQIINTHLKKNYSLQDQQSQQILLDFIKTKQTHSQQIRDFYETSPHIPLEASLSYVSYQLILQVEQLEMFIQQQFQAKNIEVLQLLKKLGKNVLTKILNAADLTLKQYKELAQELDLSEGVEQIIINMFKNNIQKDKEIQILNKLCK